MLINVIILQFYHRIINIYASLLENRKQKAMCLLLLGSF